MFCPINWCFLIFLQFQQWERVFKPSCLAAILYCSSTICSRLPVSLSLSGVERNEGAKQCSEVVGKWQLHFPAIFCPPAFPLVYADRVSGICRVFQKVTFVNCVCSLNQVWLHNVGKHAQYCRHSPLGNRCYSLHPGTGVRFVLQALYTFLQSTTSIA